MRTKTKLLVAALVAVVAFTSAISIIQTTAYNGSPQNNENHNNLQQGNCEQYMGTEANADHFRNRGMAQHGDHMENMNRHGYRHGSDE